MAAIIKSIPIHLIDDPVQPMRTEMDDDLLAGLADDIRANGLTKPICVIANGDRYNVLAGHRRITACRMIGLTNVECKDYTGTGANPRAIMVGENIHTEPISDGDMCIYLNDRVITDGANMDDLIAETHKSQHWIDKHIALARGDMAVFTALLEKRINMAQAMELNKFKPDKRAYWLEMTLRLEPSAKTMQVWRRDADIQDIPAPPPVEVCAPGVGVTPLPGIELPTCFCCRSSEMLWLMEMVSIHKHCKEYIVKAMENAEKGG